jgi:hypothetical protein
MRQHLACKESMQRLGVITRGVTRVSRDSGQHAQQARSVTQPLHARMGTHAKLSPPRHVTLSCSHHWTDISSMQ